MVVLLLSNSSYISCRGLTSLITFLGSYKLVFPPNRLSLILYECDGYSRSCVCKRLLKLLKSLSAEYYMLEYFLPSGLPNISSFAKYFSGWYVDFGKYDLFDSLSKIERGSTLVVLVVT